MSETPPLCLFICKFISSCPKEQRQDIWCNTIAGSVPRGALSTLYSKSTGASSVAQSLSSREQRTLCNNCPEASRGCCIIGCLCVQTTDFIPSLSTFGNGKVLILVMVTRCWRMSALEGSPQLVLACLLGVSSGDWMICSGVVTPRWSMLDKQRLWSLPGHVCMFMLTLGEECMCKVWVKLGVWSMEVWRMRGQRKLQWKRALADRWIALIRNP